MRVDLHIHSTASDSRWSPQRIVEEVLNLGIGLFAIADHDTVAAVPAGEALASAAGVGFLRNVEVSARLNGRLFHILAFDIDPDDPSLASLLAANRAALEQLDEVRLHALMAEGYPIGMEEYSAYEHDCTRGGWKLLSYLIDRGVCTGPSDFFRRIDPQLALGSAQFADLRDVLETIRQASGVPVVAHPGGSVGQAGLSDEALRPLLDSGIAGLECSSPYHDATATRWCLDWCRRHALLVTAGSDDHGGFVARQLGVPRAELEDLHLGGLLDRVRWPATSDAPFLAPDHRSLITDTRSPITNP
jgi:predicted metal-dependent phosphoesterase TrpH